jgi:hypothetical protein
MDGIVASDWVRNAPQSPASFRGSGEGIVSVTSWGIYPDPHKHVCPPPSIHMGKSADLPS